MRIQFQPQNDVVKIPVKHDREQLGDEGQLSRRKSVGLSLPAGRLNLFYEIAARPSVESASREEYPLLLAPAHLSGESFHNQ